MSFFYKLLYMFLSESRAFCWWGQCNGFTQYDNVELFALHLGNTKGYNILSNKKDRKAGSKEVTVPTLDSSCYVVVSEDSE